LDQQTTETLETICKSFAASVQGKLDWSWEGRFTCVVAAFKDSTAEEITGALGGAFTGTWRTDNIGEANDGVQQAANKLGLRPGQVIYSVDAADGQLFGAWWPWGGGKTISIRIFCSGADEAQLKSWFGVA
jgi:hypothetical protein